MAPDAPDTPAGETVASTVTPVAANVPPPTSNVMRAEVTPLVVNLASQEYFKSVDLKALKARVIECVFQEYRAGKYVVNAFYAKRARGLMTRYAATQRVTTPEGLKGFDAEGYAFDAAASGLERLVFRRKQL